MSVQSSDEASFPRSIFFPRRDPYPEPTVPNAVNHFVQVEEGVRLGCRFYVAGKDCPSLLYFHGNGETVGDYDYTAPLYQERRINLLVADYRGYGISDGTPTRDNVLSDAHLVFASVRELLARDGYADKLFVMGRSLGSGPAVELAVHYQGLVKGLIIESGSARGFSNAEKMRSVKIPLLVIHGQYDEMIPPEQGRLLYWAADTSDKAMLVIAEAGHNDLMLIGMQAYFQAIQDFAQGLV